MCNLVGLVLNIKGLSSAGEASFYPSLGCSFFRKESKYVRKVTAMSFFKSSCLFFYNILYVNQFHIQTDSFQEYRGNNFCPCIHMCACAQFQGLVWGFSGFLDKL